MLAGQGHEGNMDINLPIIFFVGMFVSVVGTLTGGTSLFTIPTLILLGVPPHTAIGTDRFGIMGICIAGWYKFHKKKLINYRIGLVLAVPVLFGAFLGANIVLEINEAILKVIIVIISVFCLAFLILNPSKGIVNAKQVIGRHEYLVGALMTFLVGAYGGFYGAMAGTLLLYVLIFWFGQTFLQSAATLKIGALVLNFMAAAVFAYHGAIEYHLAVALFSGCFVGSYIGAHYSDRIGNIWIRRLFVVLLIVLIINLIV